MTIVCLILAIVASIAHGQNDDNQDFSQPLVLDSDWFQNLNYNPSLNGLSSGGVHESQTYTLKTGTCEHWTYTAITQNVLTVTLKPEEFPEGCSPEKDLLITKRFYTTGECPVGKKCKEEDKLVEASNICKNWNTDMLSPFTSNSHDGSSKYLLKSKPICKEERKVLFAMMSLCSEPVRIHVEVDDRLVEDSFTENCDSPGETATIVLILAGVLVVLLCFLIARCRRIGRRAATTYTVFQLTSVPAPNPAAPPPPYHIIEAEPLTRNQGPASDQVPLDEPASLQLPSSLQTSGGKPIARPGDNAKSARKYIPPPV